MQLSSEHLFSLICTLLIVIGLGLYAAKKVKTAADYAIGGQSTGVSIVAGTIIGTILGGASTVGTAQLAFTIGLSAWWFTLGAGIALLLLGAFYARPLRSSCLQTIPQFLVVNYGPAAGPLGSITSSVGIFFSLVANILSAMPLVYAIFALNSWQAASVVFFLIVVYVFFGGLWGTGLVGVFKTVLIYVTLVTVAVLSYRGLGGIEGIKTCFPAYPWFSLFGRGFWIDFGSGLSLIVGTLSTQTYIQAVYAAKDVQAARCGAIAAGLIALPIGIPSILVGLFMKVNHPTINAIEALPLFILNYLPHWLGGIALATLLLASIGSAAGLALGVGTMLSRDIIGKILKAPSDAIMLKVSRLTVLLITLAAVMVTFGNLKSLVLEWNYLSMGLRGAGTFLPLTMAVFMPGRINGFWALWSMGAGAATSLLWKIIIPDGIDPLYAGLIVCALFILIGYIRRQQRPVNCKE